MSEHFSEPVPGLPENLPAGEEILWQGSPDWKAVARRVFHLRKLTLYFSVLVAARAAFAFYGGATPGAAAVSALWVLPLALLALATLGTIAWLVGRTSVYTITNRRVVMRIGIVLSVTFNLPLRSIESAELRLDKDGTGDIPLLLVAGNKIAYAHLWPHAKPWHYARPEPMLRSIHDVSAVAEVLRNALLTTAPDGARSANQAVVERSAADEHAHRIVAAA